MSSCAPEIRWAALAIARRFASSGPRQGRRPRPSTGSTHDLNSRLRRPARPASLSSFRTLRRRLGAWAAALGVLAFLALAVPAAHADPAGPALVGGTVGAWDPNDWHGSGTRVRLYFSEELDPAFVPVGNDDIVLFRQNIYHYDENGPTSVGHIGRYRNFSVQVDGKTLVLRLRRGTHASNFIYTVRIDDTARIRDRSGNQAETTTEPVELANPYGAGSFLPAAPGAPRLAATDPAAVDGSTLTLRFDQTLAPFVKAAGTGGFTVSGAAVATAVTHVEGHATTVTLTLDREVGASEAGIALSYVAGTPAIKNLYNQKAGGFASRSVANARADTTAPALVAGASTIAGTDVRLRFSEAMDEADPKPAASQFVLDTGTGGTDLGSVTLASIDGSVVRLSTQHAATASDTVTVSITDTSNIRDLAGNAMASVSGLGLSNTGGTAPGGPVLAGTDPAVLEGNVLTLAFDQSLDPASVPPASALSVSGGWPAAIVDAVAVDGARALLTLRRAVPGDTRGIAVSYAAGQGLRNLWGEAASGIDGQAVRVAGPDAVPPALVRAEISGAELKLFFDEALDAASTPPGAAFSVRKWWPPVPGTGTAAIQDKVVTVTLGSAGSWDEVWYAPYLAGGSPLRDVAGNEVPGVGCWGDKQCTDYGWGPPRLVSGTVSGQSVTLRFSEALDESSVPEASAFSVTVDEAAVTPGGIAVAGVAVSMELPDPAGPDAVVKVGFAGTTGIRDLEGIEAVLEDGAYTLTNLAAADPGAPAVTAVEVVSDAGSDATYALGEAIRVTLTFDEAAEVDTEGGAPRLKLDMDPADWGEKWASYESGTGTTALTFAYRVAEPNESTEGIAVLADTLELNGGTIGSAETEADADLSHGGLDHDPAHKVDWRLVAGAPVATGVAVSSSPASGDTYGSGEAIRVTLTFDEAMAVDPAGGAPRLKIDMDPADWGEKWAEYESGTGTAALLFAYEVVEPNESTQGIAVLADTLETNGGTLRSAATATDANLGHAGIGHHPDHKVDWSLTTNTPATGAPVIEGDPQVGGTLTASSGDIADADGLAGASFAWQWIHVDGGAEADIAGATENGYTLAEADEGKTIRVRATFTDDAGNAESAASAATDTVASRPPLTAVFHGVPAAHDGARRFDFELRFSEDFGGKLDYRTLRDHALSAEGGRVVAAIRAAPNQNRRWTVEVRPSSTANVMVTLAATTDCTAAAAICTPDGRPLSNSPSVTVAGPPNSPATGAPMIDGTVRVGETLTASTAGIADADGLDSATFAFQWIRVENGAQADIAGAAGSSYLLADTDEGNTIRVRVSFTDDAGNAEALTSAPTAPVAPRPQPPRVTGVAVVSDPGPDDIYELQDRILVQLTFDEAVSVDTADGPPLLTIDMDPAHWGAKQAAYSQGSGTEALSFAYTVVWPNESTQGIAVLADTLSLNGAAIRSAATNVDAVLAHTGLGHDPAHKVDWRPVLSVADAEAREAAGAAVEFTVTLSRTAQHAVRVHYATSDGTAIAGEDYTATVGTLTFPPGVTTQTVEISLIDDAVDEGHETFTLTLSNPDGARIGDGEATGTIINTDEMPKAWTARFGRTVAVHVVDAVEARLQAAPAPFVQLGGHRLGGAPDDQETVRRLAPQGDLWAEDNQPDPAEQNLTFRDLLLGSAFHLVSNPEDQATGPRLSAWGRVASSGFDAREDELSLDGTVTTAALGVDGAWKRWLSGLLMAYSEGDGSFTHEGLPGGDVSSSLTSLHPYVAYTISDRVRLWGLVGYGGGSLHLRLEDGRAMHTDLALTMGALGARGSLLNPAHPSGLELALRSDVMWMRMDSAKADNLAATQAEVSRLRLVLEGSRTLALAGGSFTPSLELGLRRDGGDAETGTGLEVGGSLRYSSTWGLSIEASARALLAHEAQGYREWGAGGALRFDPGRQGRGFTASITPTWGSASSGLSRLWDQAGTAGLVAHDPLATTAAGRLDAEFGYGLATLQGRGLLTPYARVALTEGADQAWHLGTRLALAESLNLSLEASRRAREGETAAHELALRANLGF